MKEVRQQDCPEKTPDDELQEMPHTEPWKSKSLARLEPALQMWQALAWKADALALVPSISRQTFPLSWSIGSDKPVVSRKEQWTLTFWVHKTQKGLLVRIFHINAMTSIR